MSYENLMPAINYDAEDAPVDAIEYRSGPLQYLMAPNGTLVVASEHGTTVISPDGSELNVSGGFAGQGLEEGN